MHIITQVFRIDKSYSLLRENFTGNKRKWEIIENKYKRTFINNEGYHIENKSISDWHFYKVKTPLKSKDDFIIETEIQLLSKDQFGHFGLMWGFDHEDHVMNKFTISADGERALMMQFEKDHKKIYYRIQCRNLNKTKTSIAIKLSIIKLGGYFYFCLNNELINIVNEIHFAHTGSNIGFYVDPGIAIKSNWLEIKKITARKMKSVSGLEMLLG
jgi:hypothetical protein